MMDYRNFKQFVPSAITLLAMLLSYQAIVYTVQGDFVSAAWFIWYAGLLDILDGGAARALDASTRFGKELDSLTDLVGVGVAPTLLLYRGYFEDWGAAGVVISFLFLCFVSFRLAGYNIEESHDRNFFSGLSSPVAANALVQFIPFSEDLWGEYRYPGFVLALMLAVSFLMVSRIPFEKGTYLMPRRILRTWQGWFVIITIITGLAYPSRILFIFFFGFVIVGTARALISSRASAARGAQ